MLANSLAMHMLAEGWAIFGDVGKQLGSLRLCWQTVGRTLMYWAKQNGIKITGNESKDVLIDLLLNAPNKPSSTDFVKFIQNARAHVYEKIGTVSTLR